MMGGSSFIFFFIKWSDSIPIRAQIRVNAQMGTLARRSRRRYRAATRQGAVSPGQQSIADSRCVRGLMAPPVQRRTRLLHCNIPYWDDHQRQQQA